MIWYCMGHHITSYGVRYLLDTLHHTVNHTVHITLLDGNPNEYRASLATLRLVVSILHLLDLVDPGDSFS